MLKPLLLSSILLSSLFATQPIGMKYDAKLNHVNIFTTNNASTIEENPQDWVGLYKEGTTTEWKNVLQWSWANKLTKYTYIKNGKTKEAKVFTPKIKNSGNYELRYFLNNSFTIYKSLHYKIGNVNGASLSITSQNQNTITLKSTKVGKAWIGIYEKGSSNEWGNVKAWSWVTADTTTINISKLKTDKQYEARLFYNNSYKVEKKVLFTKDGVNQSNISITSKTKTKITLNSTYKGSKSWIGIYKKGSSNAWSNVKAWSWVKSNSTTINISALGSGSYEARLFYNNSYNLEAKVDFKQSKEIKYQKEIHDSFDEHKEYFLKQIPQRLPYTSYVLYDVQTFLQNAVIYADEKSDNYMLKELLKLVKIPLEIKYLTNGEWVEKEGGYEPYMGREVELCVSQYFSLLTRVLSACERHNINTNLSVNDKIVIENHIDKWITKPIYKKIKIDDREEFFVMSVLQYYDYLKQVDKNRADIKFNGYNDYLSTFKREKLNPAWSNGTVKINGISYNLSYFAKDNFIDYYTVLPNSYAWSAYGSEIKDISSDNDPMAMFNANGSIKQPAKTPITYSDDISHGRRYIWFFESINRLGNPFNISISEDKLKGFANTLSYKVCRGTLEDPHFTIFVDGVDGWYRVGYSGRKSYGYSLGEMDISFVGSSYGMIGIYNPKIYDWMDAWVNKNPNRLNGYYGAYKLNYYTSKVIDLKKELKK